MQPFLRRFIDWLMWWFPGQEYANFIQRVLEWLMVLFPIPTAEGFEITLGTITDRVSDAEDAPMPTVELTVLQKMTGLTISSPVDRKGNPAPIDGPPAWSSSDESVATVVASGDGMFADIIATGVPGVAVVTVSGDADLGEGTTTIETPINVSVVSEQAVGFGLTLGAVEDK